jgi:excisionase family DNA binding protein
MSDFDLIMQELKSINEKLANIPQPTIEPPPEIIKPGELARRLGISLPTLRKMREKRKIPSISVGGDYRFNFPKVIAALEKSKSKTN